MMIVILQHGLFGFVPRQIGQLRMEYFQGIAEALSRQRHTVIATGVNPVGGVAQRAAQLHRQIVEAIPASRRTEKVLIIAHSMGGLDVREMLARCGAELAPQVAAVVTIATPHRGSPVADLVMSLDRQAPVPTVLDPVRRLWGAVRDVVDREAESGALVIPEEVRWLGLDHDAIADLTTQFCAGFNERTHNAPEVRHFWVATNCTGNVPFFFEATYDLVRREAPPIGGENDGVVATGSAEPPEDRANPWTGLGTWPVDHLNAVNMRLPGDPHRPDVTGRYLGLLTQLNARGVATPPDP